MEKEDGARQDGCSLQTKPFTQKWIRLQTQWIAKASPFPTIGGKLQALVPDPEDQHLPRSKREKPPMRKCKGYGPRHVASSPQRQQRQANQEAQSNETGTENEGEQ